MAGARPALDGAAARDEGVPLGFFAAVGGEALEAVLAAVVEMVAV